MKYLKLPASFIVILSIILIIPTRQNLAQELVKGESMQVINSNYWKYAINTLSKKLRQQIYKENIRDGSPVDVGRMKVLRIQKPNQSQAFYLINSRVQYECPPNGCSSFADPLCGSAGCAYFIYIQDGNSYRKVLSEYFKDVLPPKVPFLRVSNQLVSGLPCLEFTELINLTSSNLKSRKFCYNGKSFSLVGSETRSFGE